MPHLCNIRDALLPSIPCDAICKPAIVEHAAVQLGRHLRMPTQKCIITVPYWPGTVIPFPLFLTGTCSSRSTPCAPHSSSVTGVPSFSALTTSVRCPARTNAAWMVRNRRHDHTVAHYMLGKVSMQG